MKLFLPNLIIRCCHATYKSLLNEFMIIPEKKIAYRIRPNNL